MITVRIEAYISTTTNSTENQNITFRGEIVEFPLAKETIQLELVHPQLQVCMCMYIVASGCNKRNEGFFVAYLSAKKFQC